MAQTPSGHLSRFELIRYADDRELVRSVAERWLGAVSGAKSSLRVALSGGRITRQLFAETASLAASQKISFGNVDFFWADERCVPPTDPESNFALAQKTLFEPLGIAETKIHRLRGELDPATATAEANLEIAKIVPANSSGLPELDVVFLGMGEDGHVASLFPGASSEVQENRSPFLFITDSPKPPPSRITLSYAAIAAAKEVWVIAAGAGKENAFRDSLSEKGNTPLARILRLRALTAIFTDIQL